MTESEVLFPLLIALGQSTLIGLERELRLKSAGLRTHSLVGVGSALFVLVGKFGFTDNGVVSGDTSRVAAQVVAGIGFLGAGLIVFQRERIRGLTSAAIIWLTAAIGMACGAGMWFAGLVTVGCYYVVMFLYPALLARIPASKWSPSTVWVSYLDGRGALRAVLRTVTELGYSVHDVGVTREQPGSAQLEFTLHGHSTPPGHLVSALESIEGVTGVQLSDDMT